MVATLVQRQSNRFAHVVEPGMQCGTRTRIGRDEWPAFTFRLETDLAVTRAMNNRRTRPLHRVRGSLRQTVGRIEQRRLHTAQVIIFKDLTIVQHLTIHAEKAMSCVGAQDVHDVDTGVTAPRVGGCRGAAQCRP